MRLVQLYSAWSSLVTLGLGRVFELVDARPVLAEFSRQPRKLCPMCRNEASSTVRIYRS